MNLSNLLNQIPPEAWAAIIAVVVQALLTRLHASGKRLPILSAILDALLKSKPTSSPPNPAPPPIAPPSSTPDGQAVGDGLLLRLLWEEVLRIRNSELGTRNSEGKG